MKKSSWSGFNKKNFENAINSNDLSRWIGGPEDQGNQVQEEGQTEYQVDKRPIEPGGKKVSRPMILKWFIFLIFLVYILISYYRAPILTSIGRYLIVEHPLKKSDLIVCMMGDSVERGLAAADLYNRGLAPLIFIGREELPDGNAVLKERGGYYPESRDLLIAMLEGLGVPKPACITSDRFVESTIAEARLVKGLANKKRYRSLIIATSPIHTRRAWLTFRKVFEKDDVKILVTPSMYTNFRPEDWWKTRKYVKEVIIEYQKLLYYTLKYF